MSAQQPPLINVPIFNQINFQFSNEDLTLADADLRYLKLSGGILNGLLTTTAGVSSPGIINVSNNTQSTNATTGAIITAGGLGVSRNAHFDGADVHLTNANSNLRLSGANAYINMNNNFSLAESSTTGNLRLSGGIYSAGNLLLGNNVLKSVNFSTGLVKGLVESMADNILYRNNEFSSNTYQLVATKYIPQIGIDSDVGFFNSQLVVNGSSLYIQGAIRDQAPSQFGFGDVYGLYIDNVNATAVVGATNSSSLFIKGAPAVNSGTSFSLNVDSGTTRINGALNLGASITMSGSGNMDFTGSTGAFRYRNRYSCRITNNTTTFATVGGSWVQVTGLTTATAGFDTSPSANMAGTNIITIRQNGIYFVRAGGMVGLASTIGGRLCNITINGTNVNTNALCRQNITPNAEDFAFCDVSGIFSLSNGDVLRFYVYSPLTETIGGNTSRDRLFLTALYCGEV